MNDDRPLTSYESEQRLAVVMYGGVSLAIYIAGVAKELLGVVRATAPNSSNSNQSGVPNDELKGAEAVYRRIAQTRPGDATFPPLDHRPLLRNVTIDVISGTSAGGINGIFLAKALANNQSLEPILKLWIEEGDLAKLLNDAESARETRLAPQTPPAALLNGHRMYEKLVAAFDAMDKPERKPLPSDPPPPAFDAGRVDLFVPTTDIRGEVITLPVSNTVAREKRHRQRFHFTFDPSSNRNEFKNDRNLVLAYAARCTSSFPFAFEPFTWTDATGIAGWRDPRASGDAWTSHLMYLGRKYADRPMGDGGYLDNKPFSYAIDELARRQSHLEVKRTLFYVEPDPERLDGIADDTLQSQKPDAIENALAALISIPRYETIREDLERVVGRNNRVAQLEELERLVQEVARTIPAVKDRKKATLNDLIQYFGVGYAAYHRIKLDALIDSIADMVCSSSGIGRPEVALVIREIVKLWIGAEYSTQSDELQLLLDADFDFRIRKIAFVLRKMAASADPAVLKARETLKECYDSFYALKRQMRSDVGAVVCMLRAESALSDENLARIETLNGEDRGKAVNTLLRDTLVDLAKMPAGSNDLKEYIQQTVRPLVLKHTRAARAAVDACQSASPVDGRRLAEYYEGFESFDMVMFPIVQHGGVDEAVRVDVVRISPNDMKVKVKLAGMSVGHFGGFLEDDWRRNDIVAGRFNASEAIIRQLVADETAADALVKEAHQAIAAELLPELEKRVAASKTKRVGSSPITKVQQRQLDSAVAAVLKQQELPALLADGKVFDLEVDRAKQVRSAGRAGVILEQILRSGAVKAKLPFPGVLRWGALGGMVLTQIAIPRSFHRTVANYWGRLLALIFAVMALAGYVSNKTDVRNAGIKGFLVVTAIAALVLLLARWIGERLLSTILRAASWVAVIAAVWYIARAAGAHLPALNAAGLWSRLPTSVTKLDVFFVGVGLGLLLMSGMLSVIEDGRAAIRWVWQAVRSF
jgi:patatin-related protein